MIHWTTLRYVVVDVEGNGQQPPDLVEIGTASIVGGAIGEPVTWLVKPARSIEHFATSALPPLPVLSKPCVTKRRDTMMRLRPFSGHERGMFISIDGPSGRLARRDLSRPRPCLGLQPSFLAMVVVSGHSDREDGRAPQAGSLSVGLRRPPGRALRLALDAGREPAPVLSRERERGSLCVLRVPYGHNARQRGDLYAVAVTCRVAGLDPARGFTHCIHSCTWQ